MNILISWYAYKNDFDKIGGEIHVKEDGPTMQFHEWFYKQANYEKHVLLSTAREADGDQAIDRLKTAILRKYPHRVIEPHFVDVSDPIDLVSIKNKVERILLQYRECDIDIFFSPGTSAMQVSWYICHTTLNLQTRLLQTRSAIFTMSKKPELLEMSVEVSRVPYSAIIAEQQTQRTSPPDDYLITESLKPIYERARLVAKAERVSCLIYGASGTGKEHLARYIRQQSVRYDRPFVTVNCSALGDQLLESRLFGYVRGAFTDAREDRKGYFEEANGGTLFLDEIGDISPYMQQSLLRVLQEGEIIPVGDTKARKVNVRVLAATHRDLETMCAQGHFRWDLYYRLAVVELSIPMLSQRGDTEKRALLDFFLKRVRKEFGKQNLRLSAEAREQLIRYPFPGNVRELLNLITQLAVFAEEEISMADLPPRITRPSVSSSETFNWEEVEKNLLIRALNFFKGNQRRAWQAVGYKSLSTFRKKLKDYGIAP
ncbi:hypothetical protein GCM10028805_27380 [Spirosoma harenae]